jgi:hypothetical protein
MARIALALLLLFLALLALRVLRFAIERTRGARTGSRPVLQEMVRDPVCGIWIDRRIAMSGRRGGEWLPVCSEKCRKVLESA